MKVLEVWFTPHCIENLASYTLLTTETNFDIKGVLHPRLVFGLFLHFSQKLQHIGNK